jgi:hypothetical protein
MHHRLIGRDTGWRRNDSRLLPDASFRCVVHNLPLNLTRLPNVKHCGWRCQQDALAFSSCPIVLQYNPLPSATNGSLAARLRSRLRGERVAFLGDSMSRQLWHVGVGRLRAEESLLDPKFWNVMRYRLAQQTDCLEIFFDPRKYHDPCALDPTEVVTSLVWFPAPRWHDVVTAYRMTVMKLIRAVEALDGNFTAFILSAPVVWEFGEVKHRSNPTSPYQF